MESGACLKDSDCPVGKECKLSPPVEVCKCIGGMDACNKLGTCQTPPPPPPPSPPPPTPCQQCQSCITIMQPVVKAASASNNPFVVAGGIYTECVKNYTEMTCSSLKAAVSYSSKGGLGKRAGAICAKIGECADSLLSGGSAEAGCRNLTAASMNNQAVTLSSNLDMCTVEGLNGGNSVTGTSTSPCELKAGPYLLDMHATPKHLPHYASVCPKAT